MFGSCGGQHGFLDKRPDSIEIGDFASVFQRMALSRERMGSWATVHVYFRGMVHCVLWVGRDQGNPDPLLGLGC